MITYQFFRSWLLAHVEAYQRDRGASDEALEIVEKTVIVALAVAAAITIIGILVIKANDKANNTNL
jgi:hypothetical protein